MTPASGETIQVGALSVRFLVEAADSNGSASVFECFVPADSKMPVPHSHDAFEETIYGLDGVTTWTVDGRTLDIHPGEAVCIPRGAVHGFDNHGTEDAKFLAMSTPRPHDSGLLS
jgi:quercetin dioxygenase-like cupin family protein